MPANWLVSLGNCWRAPAAAGRRWGGPEEKRDPPLARLWRKRGSWLRRVLALDVGSIRIGLALSDPLGLTAQPLPTLTRRRLEDDLDSLVRIIKERGVEEIVVGLPINLKGIETPQTEKVRRFAEALQARLAFPIRYWDERLTTTQALRTLKHAKRRPSREKGLVDQVAAAYILQAYLDVPKGNPGV